MRNIVLGIVCCCASLFVGISSTHAEKKLSISNEKKVRAVMQRQEDAWNAGNIEDFMQTYWKSNDLVFIGKNGPKYGWEQTLENYKKSYPTRQAMGQLKFDILKISPIDAKNVFLIGKYHLKRSIGDAEGHFSLILRKIDAEWLIISDHSSSSK